MDMTDFDRRRKRVERTGNVIMAFAIVIPVALLGLILWAVIAVANDPGQVGAFIGEIVRGYRETTGE